MSVRWGQDDEAEMASDDGCRSKLSRETAAEALERILRYVRIDTQADPLLDNRPEHRQTTRTLLRLLDEEPKEIGLTDAVSNEHRARL
jgi:hypothetical protein